MELSKFRDKLVESLIGNLLMYGLNLVLPMVISRIYGVDIYGKYVYGLTIVNMALLIASLGLDVGLLYFIPKNGNKYVTASFALNAVTSIVTILLLSIIVSSSIYPYLGLVWLLSAEKLFFSIYRARHYIKSYFLIKSVGIVNTILLSYVFFMIFGAQEFNIIISTYIVSIILNVIYLMYCKDMFSTFEIHMELISYSVMIILGGVLSLLINYIDIVMIKNSLTDKDVALYQVGTQLAQFPSIFLLIVNTVFPPLVSKLYHEGNLGEVRRLYEKLTRMLFIVSLIVIMVIFVFGEVILKLYGVEYLASKMVLIYRGMGQLVNASVGSVWYIVVMTGRQKIRFIAVFISAVMNITLNYILIPVMGIEGAALASMVSTAFINILGFVIVKKILNSKVYFIV